MNSYIIYDDKDKPIAYTDDKEILEKYLFKLEKETDRNYRYKKVKYKNLSNKWLYDDLYLIQYKDTYIPSKYYQYVQIVDDSYEIKHTIDFLLRNLEMKELSRKERKHLEKTIMLLEEWYDDYKGYTPSNEELEKVKDMYEPYVEKWFE